MSRRRLSLVFACAGLLFVLFILVDGLSGINPGLGFGRDVRLLVDSQDYPQQLIDFLASQTRLGREIYVDTISDTVKMVSFSGVSDLQTFINQMSNTLWGTNILALGTFGSLSNLGQFMSTFEFYISVFVIGFMIYWTIKYKLLGLLLSLVNFMSLFASVLLLNELGYPFTYLVWFAMLLSFCMLLFQHSAIIHSISSDKFMSSKEMDRKVGLRLMKQSVAVFLCSFALYMTDLSLSIAGQYIMVVSGFMFGFALIVPFILSTLRRIMMRDDFEKWSLSFTKFSKLHTDKALRVWGIVVVIGLIVVLMGGIIFNTFSVQNNSVNNEYSRRSLFLIGVDDAQSFIEMQASFATHDILEDQIIYLVSEESAMWFIFSENASLEQLEAARDSIREKLDVDGVIYQYHSLENPLQESEFYIVLLVSLIAGFVIANAHASQSYGLLSVVFSVLTLSIFALWFSLFSVELSRMAILMILNIPILCAFVLVSTPDDLIDYQWNKRVVYITQNLISLMLSIGLPILLIIPNPADEIEVMISTLIIWCLATVSSFVVYPLFVKGKQHDKI